MTRRAQFWLFATLAFLWALLFVQALFPPDGSDVDLLHAGTVFWAVVQVSLVALAVRARRALNR